MSEVRLRVCFQAQPGFVGIYNLCVWYCREDMGIYTINPQVPCPGVCGSRLAQLEVCFHFFRSSSFNPERKSSLRVKGCQLKHHHVGFVEDDTVTLEGLVVIWPTHK